MLLKIFKFRSETAVLRSGAGKRSLAVLACVAVLAGCESIPDMPDFPSFSDMRTGLSETFNETFMSSDDAAVQEPVPAQAAARKKEAVVALDRAAVKRLQSRLAKLGFPSGPIDGIFGSQTAKAIKRYQTAHDLAVTGKVSSQFLEHLAATSASGSADPVLTTAPY